MNYFSKEEYLQLCQKLVEEQYNDESIKNNDIDHIEWIPAESEIKNRMAQKQTFKSIDLGQVKSTEIKDKLLLNEYFTVGKFKIRVEKHTGLTGKIEIPVSADLSVWELRTRTPNGMPCQIEFPVLFYKDSRFVNRSWTEQFHKNNSASNITIETIAEIIRWLQISTRLSAFM